MEERITVGTAARAQGIRGEIKVNPLTDDAERFKRLKHVIVKGAEYAVKSVRIAPNGLFISLVGVEDRTAAERLAGAAIEIPRQEAVKPGKDRYFIADIVGCSVKVDGEDAGEVAEVLQHGAADVYVVKFGEKRYMFPAVKDVFESIDVSGGIIALNGDRLREIAVYED